jgi:hypothetical protein
MADEPQEYVVTGPYLEELETARAALTAAKRAALQEHGEPRGPRAIAILNEVREALGLRWDAVGLRWVEPR